MRAVIGPRIPYRIETERLVVRCYGPEDAPLLKRAVDSSLSHLRPWMPWAAAEPQTLEEKVMQLRRFRGRFDLDQDHTMGIFDRRERVLLGGTGLHDRVGAEAREIGYWLAADQTGRGYMTETVAALTRAAFEIGALRRLEIHVEPDNARSARVPERLGYTHEATLRGRLERGGGQFADELVYSLFAEDYPGSPSARARLRAYDAAGAVLL